jgi:hypothetical protein
MKGMSPTTAMVMLVLMGTGLSGLASVWFMTQIGGRVSYTFDIVDKGGSLSRITNTGIMDITNENIQVFVDGKRTPASIARTAPGEAGTIYFYAPPGKHDVSIITSSLGQHYVIDRKPRVAILKLE